jgi:hypothetical protein
MPAAPRPPVVEDLRLDVAALQKLALLQAARGGPGAGRRRSARWAPSGAGGGPRSAPPPLGAPARSIQAHPQPKTRTQSRAPSSLSPPARRSRCFWPARRSRSCLRVRARSNRPGSSSPQHSRAAGGPRDGRRPRIPARNSPLPTSCTKTYLLAPISATSAMVAARCAAPTAAAVPLPPAAAAAISALARGEGRSQIAGLEIAVRTPRRI